MKRVCLPRNLSIILRNIWTSKIPDVMIPNYNLTQYVFERADEFGNNPAMVCGMTGRALSFAQMKEMTYSLAGGLVEKGFQVGDTLAIYAPNIPEYGPVFHSGVSQLGQVTTVNPLSTAKEIQRQLVMTKTKFIFTIPQLVVNLKEAIESISPKPQIFVIGEDSFAQLCRSTKKSPVSITDGASRIAVLPTSSGTTGLPKAVKLSHSNVSGNIQQFMAMEHYDTSNVFLAILPFFHIYGMLALLNGPVHAGSKTIVLPRFDLELYLKLIQQHKVTHLHVAPPVCIALLHHPLVAKYDMSSVKCIFSGAAPLGAELQTDLIKKLGCDVRQGYGMTEMSPVSHIVPHGVNAPGSAGQLVPNTSCKIMDVSENKELSAEEEGELWIKGPQIMLGYLDNPTATEETLTPDGWLRTGDLAKIDKDGNLYITDRLKELVKFKGYQVAPAELEALLLTHPKVQDALVYGFPDLEAGELPRAWIVPKDPSLTAEEVISFVGDRVAPYKQLRGGVKIVTAVPKSASGKLLRRVAKQEDTQ